MFNLFKKDNFNRKMPGEYKHLMNQRAYENMLDTILQYFKEKGETVLKVGDGYIFTRVDDGDGLEFNYGLDNLVRLVAAAPQEDKESVIYSHFNKVDYDSKHMLYFKKDYEAAKQHLKILVKPNDLLSQEIGKNIIYQVVFPGTVCALVFDYDEKFAYLDDDDIKEWDKTTDELFYAAQQNINGEQVNVHQIEFEGSEIEVFAFFSGDFSAPFVIDLEQNSPFAIGEFGAMVAIPTKGTAFAAPLGDKEIIKRVELLTDTVQKFFNEDPGHITQSFYWLYEGNFEIFPETPSEEKAGYITISLPFKLSQLLNEE
jgi:hypothetical protein